MLEVVIAEWIGGMVGILIVMLVVTRLLMLLTWPWRKRLGAILAVDLVGLLVGLWSVATTTDWDIPTQGLVAPLGHYLQAATIAVPAMILILLFDLRRRRPLPGRQGEPGGDATMAA